MARRNRTVNGVTLYKLAKRDPEFKAGKKEALEEHVEPLEAEADRRAVERIDHPVTYEEKITATYKRYSGVLLMFRLKALAPEKYRDKLDVHVQTADDFFGAIQAAKEKSD